MNAKTVVFHHIPKTAGTTLNDILLSQYATGTVFFIHGDKKETIRNFKELSEEDRMKYRLVYGHQAISVIEEVSNPILLTMFRHPVDRVVSLYYFARRNTRHAMHKLTNEYSLESFFQNGMDEEWSECNNGQFNSIKNILQSRCFESGIGTDMERIKRILEKHVVFGILERFDESILLFREQLMWTRALYYSKKNVTDRAREYPDAVIQRITAQNTLDMELYTFAKEQFEKRIESRGEPFAKSLLKFKRLNQYLGPLFSMKSRYLLIKRRLRDM